MRTALAATGLATLLLAGCATMRSGPEDRPPAAPLDLYLLAGQSNMAGRGTVAPEDTAAHPRVFALRADGTWGPARDPLHFDKPRVAGVGPGLAFGKALAAERPGVRIGLIPAAVGGTALRVWAPGVRDAATGAHPYDDALARVRRVQAAHGGQLRAVLWLQGESDSGTATADGHAAALEALVVRLRADLGVPDLPFIAARLAPYYVAGHPGAANINAALDRLATRLPGVVVVGTEGLRDGGDGTHLNAPSAWALGLRFADALLRLR